MSVGISNSDLADLTKTTLENLPDMEFEVAFKYQEYNVINRWFQGDKKQFDSGTSIKRNIVLDTTGNARHVRLYQRTPINIADTQYQLSAPWVQAQTHWSIERREMLRNRKPAAFVDLLKSRRIDGSVDMANLLEERAWASPNNSSDDLNPYGVPYWINKLAPSGYASYNSAVDVDQDFSGRRIVFGDATFSLTKAGLTLTATTTAAKRFRNYAATYTAINSDFVLRMRRAFHATNFKSPMIAKDLKDGPAADYRIYMGLDNLTAYEDLVTKQNDNNGADLDPFNGNTTFKRVPILYTPQLDSDTDSPVYAVNHKYFFPIVLSGDWMRENDPMFDVEQHNVMTTFVDCSYQYFCTNVRLGGFVIHKTLSA